VSAGAPVARAAAKAATTTDWPAGPGDHPSPPVGVPPVGAIAPLFTLSDEHGTPFDLAAELTRGPVFVVFYPFAFSGTCTGELTGLLDLDEQMQALGVRVVAVSCDQLFALRAFSDSSQLSFPLLSDFWPHGAVASAYGVFDTERGCSVRGSFLVAPDGVIAWSVVNPRSRARDILAHLEAAAALATSLLSASGAAAGTLSPGV